MCQCVSFGNPDFPKWLCDCRYCVFNISSTNAQMHKKDLTRVGNLRPEEQEAEITDHSKIKIKDVERPQELNDRDQRSGETQELEAN